MLRVADIRIPVGKRDRLGEVLSKLLGISEGSLPDFRIRREALDARKEAPTWVYSIEVELERDQEQRLLAHGGRRFSEVSVPRHEPPEPGQQKLDHRPIVIGAGPAGLFAALTLAERGYRPLLLERGQQVEQRQEAVERFWATGALHPESNVAFGEGGAGTFSDGKLNTQMRDLRIADVLSTLVACGAPGEILYQAAPHLGSDKLKDILINLRARLLAAGAELRFEVKLSDLLIDRGKLKGAVAASGEIFPCTAMILAIGHSAADTYEMLQLRGVDLQAKAFSMGLRIEQLQAAIDRTQYGNYAGHPDLPASSYKLVQPTSNGRSAYTFCMCPGGEVVASSSEEGHLVTNGMSLAARDGVNANAGLLVGVSPEDFGNQPLAGLVWQRIWERAAFRLGGSEGRAPIMRVDDFCAGKLRGLPHSVSPSYRPGVRLADLDHALPSFVSTALREALPLLEAKLPGFAPPDALLTAVESRSSSPVRIPRDATGCSTLQGLYPAGEGAGYAGGIVSAAVDGIRAAEAIIASYRPAR